MNLEDLKDQIREMLTQIWATIQDSPTFNTVKEQFETLPSNIQKAITTGGVALVVILLLMIPWSYFSQADIYEEEYNANKQVIRELLKVSRYPKGQTPLPAGQSLSSIMTKYKSTLNQFELLPEQIGAVKPLGRKEIGALSKPPVIQEAFSISLKDLNLQQVLDVGYRMQSMQQNVKMIGLDIQATAKNDHYFNVIYNLVSFTLPVQEEEEGTKSGKKGRKSRRSKRKRRGK